MEPSSSSPFKPHRGLPERGYDTAIPEKVSAFPPAGRSVDADPKQLAPQGNKAMSTWPWPGMPLCALVKQHLKSGQITR